jgi:hypothetical protein
MEESRPVSACPALMSWSRRAASGIAQSIWRRLPGPICQPDDRAAGRVGDRGDAQFEYGRNLPSELDTHKDVTAANGETTAMPRSIEDAAAWRAKATESRAHAAGTRDPQPRSSLLKIAESYEHLAAIVEKAAADTKLKLFD